MTNSPDVLAWRQALEDAWPSGIRLHWWNLRNRLKTERAAWKRAWRWGKQAYRYADYEEGGAHMQSYRHGYKQAVRDIALQAQLNERRER